MSSNSECSRCGHVEGWPIGFPLGTFERDVLAAAYESSERFRAGDENARRATAILDMVWLAARRGDDEMLDELERVALKYIRDRSKDEQWSPNHGAWSGNASAIRALVSEAEDMLEGRVVKGALDAESVGTFFLPVIARYFPYLPGIRAAEQHGPTARGKLMAEIARIAQEAKGDGRQLAKRGLMAAGMPRDEAHQRFAFLRLESSRANRKRRRKRAA